MGLIGKLFGVERACDCAFDVVPLRGPDKDCTSCKGSGLENISDIVGLGYDDVAKILENNKADWYVLPTPSKDLKDWSIGIQFEDGKVSGFFIGKSF